MNINFRAPVSTAIAVLFGSLILLTYIFPWESIRTSILRSVGLLAATALLLGVFNLVGVHFNKMRSGSGGGLYSLVLILALVITFGVTILQGSDGTMPQWIFQNIQIPVETSLMAVMTVTLAYSSARLLSRRTTLLSILFVVFTLITLLGSGPIFGIQFSFLSASLKPWITQVLAGAGARGLLIGVALGTITAGLRILMGADRPFGG